MAANMWKNSLKNVESNNNKILYETLLDFLQRNGTYIVNKPRNMGCSAILQGKQCSLICRITFVCFTNRLTIYLSN